MKKIAILHFQPLDLYPPVLNLIALLNQHTGFSFTVYTSASEFKKKIGAGPHIKIKYWGVMGASASWKRLWHYVKFNAGTTLHLLYLRPSTVMYYESYSAFPALVYQWIFPKTRLLVHYHEHHEPEWYEQGMKTVKWFHQLEKKMAYPKAKWISQTNRERLDMFLKNNNLLFRADRHFVVPNYPLRSWGKNNDIIKTGAEQPVRMVYVGSFSSMHTLYIKELLEWIKFLRGAATLDIYFFSTTPEIREWIETLQCSDIRLMDKVDYENLPDVLKNYQVGVIIYKGVDTNFVFNAPNKLFEYLACGLDVWYPQEMEGCYEYDSAEYWPKVLRLEFNNLKQYDIQELVNRKEGHRRGMAYYYEVASEGLVKELLTV